MLKANTHKTGNIGPYYAYAHAKVKVKNADSQQALDHSSVTDAISQSTWL